WDRERQVVERGAHLVAAAAGEEQREAPAEAEPDGADAVGVDLGACGEPPAAGLDVVQLLPTPAHDRAHRPRDAQPLTRPRANRSGMSTAYPSAARSRATRRISSF